MDAYIRRAENKKQYKKYMPPKITNEILKIRTGTYPFSYLLKHWYQTDELTDNCPLCDQAEESLHHILYDCTAYEDKRKELDIKPSNKTDAELLSRISTSNNPNMTNMFKIYTMLQHRWELLSPILDEIKNNNTCSYPTAKRNRSSSPIIPARAAASNHAILGRQVGFSPCGTPSPLLNAGGLL